MAFGIFKHCCSPASEAATKKPGLLVDVVDVTERSNSYDSHEEQSTEENWSPVVRQSKEWHQKLLGSGIEIAHPDIAKLQQEEDFRVVETKRNSILVSPTKVMVFQKDSLSGESQLLHIHKRVPKDTTEKTTASKRASKKKTRRLSERSDAMA